MKSPNSNAKPESYSEPNSGSSSDPVGVRWMKEEARMVAAKASELEIMKAKDRFMAKNLKPAEIPPHLVREG